MSAPALTLPDPAPISHRWLDFNDAPSQYLCTPKPEQRLDPEELKLRLKRRLAEALYHLFPAGRIVQNNVSVQ